MANRIRRKGRTKRARRRVHKSKRIRRIIRKYIIRRPVKKIIVKRPIRRIVIRRIIRRKRIVVKRVTQPRLPKIKIKFADTYDEAFHSASEKRWTHKALISGRRFARLLRRATAPNLTRFLNIVEDVSGLRWRTPVIHCYVVHETPFDFHDPVTIRIVPQSEMRVAVETLFHELTHQLVEQNHIRLHKRNYMAKKYANENRDVKDHIFDQAIMKITYEKLYGHKKTKRIIKAYWPWKGHWRAWQIIRKEGADKIIKAYTK